MGFPSPGTDYVERRLTPAILCNMGANSRVLETDVGFAVIEPATKKTLGDVLLILCDGHTQFAKLMARRSLRMMVKRLREQRLKKWKCWVG